MDWLDKLNAALERATEMIDPGTPAADGTREHKRGARLHVDRHPHAGNARRVAAAERDMLAWERALLRAHPGDEPGVRLLGNGGLTRRQETEGIALLGAPGTGKTLRIRRILEQAIPRGDLVLVHDTKGEYTAHLLAVCPETTALLAPWDRRGVPWVIGDDIRTRLDAEDAAATFIPRIHGDQQSYWRDTSRVVTEGVFLHEQAEHAGKEPWSWGDVWHDWFAKGRVVTAQRLARSAEGRTAATAIAGEAKRASSEDVWSTLLSIVSPLKHLAAAWPGTAVQPSISVRAWLAGATPYQVVILPTLSQYHELGKTVARLWIEVAARQLLSLPDSATRRVWFLLDEAPALGDLPALLKLQVEGRAKGGRTVIGTQDIGQLRAGWGRDRAMALLNVGTLLVFRVSDPELAEWAAKALGRREITEWTQTKGEHHGHESSHSSGWSAHTREEYLVMPSELAQLRPLVAYVRVAGWPCVMPWSWSTPRPDAQQAPVVEEAGWVSQPITLDAPPPSAPGARPPRGLARGGNVFDILNGGR